MNAVDFLKFGNALSNGIKDAIVGKWKSHEDHEEVTLLDKENNRYEIKFYPNKKENQK